MKVSVRVSDKAGEAIKREALREHRSVSKQLEWILENRYNSEQVEQERVVKQREKEG